VTTKQPAAANPGSARKPLKPAKPLRPNPSPRQDPSAAPPRNGTAQPARSPKDR
jgi:hypothetical protein